MSSTKGFRYAKTGPIAKVLKLETYSVPRLSRPSDALVEVLYAPVHRTDAAIINGVASGRVYTAAAAPNGSVVMPNAPFPRVAGAEGLARVVDPGTSDGVKKGDIFWIPPLVGVGTWADFAVVDTNKAVKVSDAAAKALPLELLACGTGLVAAYRLMHGFGQLEKGSVVVQNGGSSLISLAVSALAQRKGVTVVTAAAEGARFKEATTRHAVYGSQVVPYSSAGSLKAKKLIAALKPACGGANAFFNGVGGRPFNSFLKLTGEGSVAVTYGAQNSFGLMWAGSQHIWKDMTHTGLNVPRYLYALPKEQRTKLFHDAVTALADVKFSYPTQNVSLEGLPEAWNSTVLNGGKKFVVTFKK